MPRTFTYSALVLRIRPTGESNREAFFLTAEAGILAATLYGGPKSRLRSHVSPFHRGTLWLYHDPVRDSRKVTDFDVRSWRPGIREDFRRSMTAFALAETVLASHGGGGNWTEALALTDRALDALEGADEGTCGRIGLHFLWNWAEILGIRPLLDRCASCACEAGSDEVLYYSPGDGGLHCASCGGLTAGPGLRPLGGGARRWLKAVEALDPALLSRYTLDRESARQVKTLGRAILEGALERPLRGWDAP
ncbi:MAG: DNA repair protein RecO C-terminal domain-containing protein [Spirochaetaceae bacterium]|jgi:DNA repair protein RecO (recombination protein O)|nr:DNA repair protein RecO C-terminal domain-containing protein [Spirochaetaceae bacterium]